MLKSHCGAVNAAQTGVKLTLLCCEGCRDGWESHGTGCYKVPRRSETYSGATAICGNMGGIIATAKDQSELDQFQTIVAQT